MKVEQTQLIVKAAAVPPSLCVGLHHKDMYIPRQIKNKMPACGQAANEHT